MARTALRHSAIERVTRTLPPALAARLDLMRPDLASGFGALNGQEIRQSILENLMRAFSFDLIIETGTYRGTTTEWLRSRSRSPIVTIEVSRRYYEYALRRLAGLPEVRVVLGESSAEIRRLAASPTHHRDATVFAYLDAHWGSTLPVRCELLELLAGWDCFCAVIDDFKVPTDDGYGYDDYGPGLVLEESVLSGLPLEGCSLYYPHVPASAETGYRRGWAVVGRGEGLLSELTALDGLIRAETGRPADVDRRVDESVGQTSGS
jgi:hypothetical protein